MINDRLEIIMQEAAYLRETIKVAPIAMALHTGTDMQIVFANELMLSAWAKDSSVFGKPFSEGVPELTSFAFLEEMNNVYSTGIPFSAEEIQMEYLHNDAPRTFYYSYGFTPVKNEDGSVWGILNYAKDVTEQVLGREAITRLEEKSAMLQREQLLNEKLLQTQQDLQRLNNELEKRVAQRTKELSASENRFRAVIDQAPVSIVVFRGEEMVIDAINPPMLRLLNRSANILGKPLLTAIPELANQDAYKLLHKIYTTGEPVYGFDTPVILNRTGKEEVGYFNFSYTPLIEYGQIVGIIDMAIEVTDQVKARKAILDFNDELTAINAQLSESEANLRLAIEAASLGIWYYEMATGNLHVDLRCKQLYGFKAMDKITVADIQKTTSPEYLPILQTTLLNAIEKKQACDIQYPITHLQTGQQVWLRTIGKVDQTTNNTIRFFGVTMEITEQKKDEQRKNDFIGMVSHELKTPLTSLGGYIQILIDKARKNNSLLEASLLEKSYGQVKRMTTMINGFLNLSRLESGKIQVDKSDFVLDELINEMIEETSTLQPRHSITFHPCHPLTVHADRDKIGSVISNLLSNAIKYSPNNRNVIVTCQQVNDTVQVSVIDKGIGIRPEDREKLFERFYRVKGNNSISGFGIGLYLSAEIIQRHQGRIWVESEPDKGSTFSFTLPLKG